MPRSSKAPPPPTSTYQTLTKYKPSSLDTTSSMITSSSNPSASVCTMPDFKKLQHEWQQKLELKKKACLKAPTKPQAFNFTLKNAKSSTSTAKRPPKDNALAEPCVRKSDFSSSSAVIASASSHVDLRDARGESRRMMARRSFSGAIRRNTSTTRSQELSSTVKLPLSTALQKEQPFMEDRRLTQAAGRLVSLKHFRLFNHAATRKRVAHLLLEEARSVLMEEIEEKSDWVVLKWAAISFAMSLSR